MREALTSPLWAARDFEPATGPGRRLRRQAASRSATTAPGEPVPSVEIPRCKECRRPLRRRSPDGLGPICRAKQAAKTGLRISPLSITRAPTALVDGQIPLFDELEEEQ